MSKHRYIPPSELTDRPQADERGADCLVPLLRDFLALDLRRLPPEAFEEWVGLVADCLWTFAECEIRQTPVSLRAKTWFHLLTDHLAVHFPDYQGGVEQIRIDLACLMLGRRRQRDRT